jgi:hypothetical protein
VAIETWQTRARFGAVRLLRSDAFRTLLIAIVYFQVVFGFAIMNPRNLQWLVDVQHDLMMFLTTTSYYRFSSWSFPITRFDTLAYPVGTSIAVADAVPLLAVPFKLLDPLLPRGAFQYFGAWMFVCVWLQALVAKRTFALLKVSPALQWIGTLLLTANLPQAFAIFHFPHWAQFLILYGFYLVLQPELPLRRVCGLLVVTTWVNPYLLVMVLATVTAVFVRHWRTPRLLSKVALAGAITVFSCYLVGYFHFSAGQASEGDYMADLDTLFNAQGTGLLGPKLAPLREYDQGYGYLGLGGLAMLLLLLVKPFWPAWRKRQVHSPALLIVCVLMALYAFGTNPLFRGQQLGQIGWLHDLAAPLLSRLRSTGRFIWPIWSYIILFGVYGIHQLLDDKRVALGAGLAVLALQVVDVGPWLMNPVRPIPPPGVVDPVPADVSAQLNPGSRIMLLSPKMVCQGGPRRRRNMWGLSLFGIEHRLATNSDFGSLARYARDDQQAICRATKELWRKREQHPEIVFVKQAH